MNTPKRWLCLVLSLVLTVSLILPAGAVDPQSTSFASFLINAESTDTPTLDLHVALYRRSSAGTFSVDDSVRYRCSINRTAGKTAFYIQPQADRVWVEVDYLTDLNYDGIYEMLDGEDLPVHDIMNTSGQLVSRNSVTDPWTNSSYALAKGQTYILSAETLRARGQQSLRARCAAGNAQAIPGFTDSSASERTLLYLVTLHYLSAVDQEEYTLSYYLRLFDSVIIPSDVPANAWYYETVEYVLQQGLFSGTGADSFSPTTAASRAMVWTVLAKVRGKQLSAGNPWYVSAQRWAVENRISDGFGPNEPITREQLVQMLYRLASPEETPSDAVLSAYPDSGSISSWARAAMAWAVENGIISGQGNGNLAPGGQATRAEMAAMLRQYIQKAGQ